MEKITFHWIFFVHYMIIGRTLSKKVLCPKKLGVIDLLKPQNPGEVVVLAKSALFVCKYSSVQTLSE